PGAAAGQLEAVVAPVAPDIEGLPAAEVFRDVAGEGAPLERGKIAQGMVRRGANASGQVQVVEPGPEGRRLLREVGGLGGTARAFGHGGPPRGRASAVDDV